jgi:hypothetical protein
MDTLKPYAARQTRGRFLLLGPGTDGLPMIDGPETAAHIVSLMNKAYEEGVMAERERMYEIDRAEDK